MYANVALWDSQTLITYLIKNDLKNEKLRHECSTKLKRSTLYESVFSLLGITEPGLVLEFSRRYGTLRREINDQVFSAHTLKQQSDKILKELVFKAGKNAAVARQKQFTGNKETSFDFNKVIINLIKNDLIQKSNLRQLTNFPEKINYAFNLHKPVLWLMKVWDKRRESQFQDFYLKKMDQISNKNKHLPHDVIDNFATKIFEGINRQKSGLTC